MNDQIAGEEHKYLEKCLEEIEKKMGWGNPLYWTNANFEDLKEELQSTSHISISVKTLRRLFRKEKSYEGRSPQIFTKNALVSILGFKHWDDYVMAAKNNEQGNLPALNIQQGKQLPAILNTKKITFFFIFIVLLLLTLWQVLLKNYKNYKADFTAKQLNSTFPLIYGFYYNIDNSQPDEVLSLDFDDGSEARISSAGYTNKTYTTPYLYHPKILINEHIIKTINVLVPSQGWKATTQNRLIDTIRLQGKLFLDPERLRPMDIKFANSDFFIEYRNFNNFNWDGGQIVLTTRIRHDYVSLTCASYELEMVGEKGKLYGIFTDPGCSKWGKVEYAGTKLSGEDANFKKFEQNLYTWNDIRFETHNNTATIFFNNQQIYTIVSQHSIGKIKGFVIRFKGTGSVDYFYVHEKGRLVYKDDF